MTIHSSGAGIVRPNEENATRGVMQTAPRRELQLELSKMGQMLRQQVNPDEMTREIIDWHRRLIEALKKGEAEAVLQRFIPLLQDILVDPISQAPLDEETYLGSDGNTYGHQTLVLHSLGVSQSLKERSPLDPDNPAIFTVSPHHVARELVRWLQQHHALLRSEEHDRLFEQLIRQVHAPKPTGGRAERLRRIQERQEAIKQERKEELGEFCQRIRQEVSQEVQRAFQPLQKRILEVGAKQAASITALAKKDQKRLEIVENKLGNQYPIQQAQAFQQQLNHVQNMIENTLEAQIAELEKGNHKLNYNNRVIKSQINNVDHCCQEVQVQIREAETARKKAKKGKIKQVFTAIGGNGLCVFSTWAVMGIAAACGISGASAAVIPVNKGAMLGIGVAL